MAWRSAGSRWYHQPCRRHGKGISTDHELLCRFHRSDNPLNIPDEREHIGLSAQQVEKVIPEAVTKNGKGYRMVENDPILWAMLNAIKEQQRQIEAQQAQLEELKASLNCDHRD